ncbi:unnamed protein product [Echinostoma caproni]|uniref:Uncharacterized protein n=1 Tax=Echinostoma caproni TaxID=27848 RepID=A0A183BBA8_9TREM|nr:unnamed protein product [Echinostoma caproni]
MADRVYADQLSVQSDTQPAPPLHSTDNAELVVCVKALVAQVQPLTSSRNRPRQRRRMRSNHRSRSPRRPRSRSPSNGICWYHHRYGDAAKRCLTVHLHPQVGKLVSRPAQATAVSGSSQPSRRPTHRDTFPG